MNTVWYLHLLWVVGAALLGLAVAGIFSGWLRLPRNIYLVIYIGATFLFAFAFFQWSGISVIDLLLRNWQFGLLGAIILSFISIRHVLSQPASSRSQGLRLVFEILWSGFLYRFADALLLTVLPVLATWQAFTLLNWPATWPGTIAVGILAILSSMFVTTAYHLGYTEFRGKQMMTANVGYWRNLGAEVHIGEVAGKPTEKLEKVKALFLKADMQPDV